MERSPVISTQMTKVIMRTGMHAFMAVIMATGFATHAFAHDSDHGSTPSPHNSINLPIKSIVQLTHGSFRDKHGNPGAITLETPIVNPSTSGIDYTVPYNLTDSEGAKSGEYRITSEKLQGRDPLSDDFVLNVFVSDDATDKAAELVIRNNPNVSPLAPILRLLDNSSSPAVVEKTNSHPEWGAFIIRGQSDIANYPIELLDARVITQLLRPTQLSHLPNSAAGTGNWADIMENHRTNFEEAKFRADVDLLGNTQSDLLTSRMITEIESKHLTPDDWLPQHHPAIHHHGLTFLTDHKNLIEKMTTTLHDRIRFNMGQEWPLNHTIPFGRMPVWLVDPDNYAGPDSGQPLASDCGGPGFPCHFLPLHWERVIAGQDPLKVPGCWHDFPAGADVPTLTNGSTNLGQFECADTPTASGFVDRPCIVPADYTTHAPPSMALMNIMEGQWHDPIHVFMGGSFLKPALTSGTMAFWTFHTYASTSVLSNWKHAQKRDMPSASTFVPLPSAAWMALPLLGVMIVIGKMRRRRCA